MRAYVRSRFNAPMRQRQNGCFIETRIIFGSVPLQTELKLEQMQMLLLTTALRLMGNSKPIALGGTNDLKNLRCLCRQHNLLEAEIKLGKAKMAPYRRVPL